MHGVCVFFDVFLDSFGKDIVILNHLILQNTIILRQLSQLDQDLVLNLILHLFNSQKLNIRYALIHLFLKLL